MTDMEAVSRAAAALDQAFDEDKYLVNVKMPEGHTWSYHRAIAKVVLDAAYPNQGVDDA